MEGDLEADLSTEHGSSRVWLWLLLTGTAIWALATGITAVTQDTILVPTVVLVGSFLVPTTMVAFAVSRSHDGRLGVEVLLIGFLGGGTLGVLLSALTETYLLPSAYGTFVSVGFIEEFAKGVVVALVAARLVPIRDARDGIILGATVGAGFASFESAGYALSAVIGHSDDHPILRIVQTEVTRAVLAPFGHITWTALFGGALFAASRSGALRVTRGVLLTFAGIVLLHGAWDAAYGWAIMVTEGLIDHGWHFAWPNTEAWVGTPTGHTLVVFQAVYDGLLLLNGVIGASWVVRRWRRAAGRPSQEAR